MNKDFTDDEFDRLLDQHFSNDTQVKRSFKLHLYYQGLSDEKRKEFGSKITEGKVTVTREEAKEIWNKVWGEDRGTDLYKKLSIEYQCAIDAITSIARGTHIFCKVPKEKYKKLLKEWHEKYGYNKNIYIARSPGNDLLDYYDQKNSERKGCKVSKLSPSEIFEIRFRWTDKSRKKIKEYCDSKGLKVDGAMYDTYRNKTMSWLIDEPHQEWEFDSFVEMSKWIHERVGKPFNSGGQTAHGLISKEMIWSEKDFNLQGWSFIVKK